MDGIVLMVEEHKYIKRMLEIQEALIQYFV
jgi:hemerythrin-like domain-containing protein